MTRTAAPVWTASARPPLETPRLVIAPLAAEDACSLAAVSDDPEILGRVHFLEQPFDAAAARALIEADPGFNGIRLRAGGTLIGMIGTHFGPNGVEIGYWIGAGHRRRGHAREAIAAVVAALGEVPIFAECAVENRASWQLLEAAGFAPTGRAGHRPGRQVLDYRRPPAPC